jgi:hypothetical protein
MGALLKEVGVPFRSQQQRKFMYSQHPDIAKRWTAEEKGHMAAAKRKLQRGKKNG